MVINPDRKYCYRITHRDNLPHILEYGLVNKHHAKADANFISIGNTEIIDVRGLTQVKIDAYGNLGEYIPFYLTPRSIMLYNIVTGYYAPKVRKRTKDEIVIIRCLVASLAKQPCWFFTDGQANDGETTHFNELKYFNKIDWDCIQTSNFSKSDSDYDRQRRYQAEFLVRTHVPVDCIESICVNSEQMKTWTESRVYEAGLKIPVNIEKPYFFD